MGKLIDLTGRRFGKLVVIERGADHIQKGGYSKNMWICLCDCGCKKAVYGQALRSGKTIDCGCGSFERHSEQNRRNATTHGGSNTRLYRIWRSMRERCNNKESKTYPYYGGRGISVFHGWDNFDNFRDWALQHGYKEDARRGETTLDRIDVNGNYSPDNCRFTNQFEQCRNKRNNRNIEFCGKTQCLSDWSKETGINRFTIYNRLKAGWSVEKALTVPVSE